MRRGFFFPIIVLVIVAIGLTSYFVFLSKQRGQNETKKRDEITLTSGEEQVNLKIYNTIVHLRSGATIQFEHGQGDLPQPDFVTAEKYKFKQASFAELSPKLRTFLHNGYRYDLQVLNCNVNTVHDYNDNTDYNETKDCLVNVKIVKGPNLENPKEVESWNTFKSNRVNLSFKYPDYWFVAEAPENTLANSDLLEAIAFSNEYSRNATNDQFGYIFVHTATNYGDVDGLVSRDKKDYEQQSEEFKKSYDPPEFTFTEFGAYRAVSRRQKYNGPSGNLTPQANNYIFVNDGLVYYISLAYTNFADLDPDEQEYVGKILNKILSTIKFQN